MPLIISLIIKFIMAVIIDNKKKLSRYQSYVLPLILLIYNFWVFQKSFTKNQNISVIAVIICLIYGFLIVNLNNRRQVRFYGVIILYLLLVILTVAALVVSMQTVLSF